jgi:hypothetical protein
VDYVNIRKIGTGAAFVNTLRTAKDEWRLSASGRQEGVSERQGHFVQLRTAPLKPKDGLNGPPANDCNTWAHNVINQSTPHDITMMIAGPMPVVVQHNVVVYADGSIHSPGGP